MRSRIWRTEQVSYRDDQIAGAFEVHAFRPEPGKVAAAFLDVTDRKRSEEALRESEERYRAIFDSVEEAIFIHDPATGQIVDHNAKLEEMYGFEGHEVPHLRPEQTSANVPPWTAQEAYEHLRAAAKGEHRFFEWHAKRKDGSLFWVEVSLRRARIGGQDRILASARDVTDRKEAREALQERERQLATLMRNLPGMVYRCRNVDEWTMEFVSEGCLPLTGYAADDLVGSRLVAYGELIHPDDRQMVWDEVQAAIAERRSFRLLYRLVAADGTMKWVTERGVGVFSDDGTLSFIEGFVFDVSDRVHAEEQVRLLNARLEQRVQERTAELQAANEELEAFSYSVSHDLRAPLRGILGFAQALAEDHGDALDVGGRDYLDRVRRSALRMDHLIEGLLELSRVTRASFERTQVDLSAVAADVIGDLRRDEPEREVDVAIAPRVTAHGDPRLVRVVLANLLGNAWKFTSLRERARIEFGSLPDGDASEEGAAESRTVYFVRDNGAGFDMEWAERLFGPFQRLHDDEAYPGSGVGLATVQRIVHRHGGHVWAEGEPGRGATFYFTL